MAWMVKIVRIAVWCFGCLIVLFSILLLRIYHGGRVSDIPKADTIIVLGAAQWNGTPSPMFKARLDRAAELYGQGYAPSIIVTGGKPAHAPSSDAVAGKTYLVGGGIPADRIFVEERSRTTLENLVFSKEIMREQRYASALLVSHDFHLMRAQRMARDLGIATIPASVKTKSRAPKLRYAFREAIVHIAYLLFRI